MLMPRAHVLAPIPSTGRDGAGRELASVLRLAGEEEGGEHLRWEEFTDLDALQRARKREKPWCGGCLLRILARWGWDKTRKSVKQYQRAHSA